MQPSGGSKPEDDDTGADDAGAEKSRNEMLGSQRLGFLSRILEVAVLDGYTTA